MPDLQRSENEHMQVPTGNDVPNVSETSGSVKSQQQMRKVK
jgi:hypothetical protein